MMHLKDINWLGASHKRVALFAPAPREIIIWQKRNGMLKIFIH